MSFDIAKEIPRIGQRAEILTAWYLRFNSYFPLTAFILHDAGARKQRGGQLTDADILAVRLPYTSEIIEGTPEDIFVRYDPSFNDYRNLTEFVIGEASSQECKFNWLEQSDAELRSYLRYVLRRFGYWPEAGATAVVERLADQKHFEGLDHEDFLKRVRIWLTSFGVKRSSHLPPEIVQVTHRDILEYLSAATA